MKTLTVFTPTYNRAHTLGRVYDSLCRQTCKDFEWIIIDDGSTDNTKDLVESWVDSPIDFRYIYKENGGLHTGYNKAIEVMTTEICVCIDSDDYMPDDAVEFIVNYWKEHCNEDIAGFVGLDVTMDGKQLGAGFPDDLLIHYIELKQQAKYNFDNKIVMRVDLLKQVAPQPSFSGEKNFNPIWLILKIDQFHPFRLINKCLCIVDYQIDGMSVNIINQYFNSPNSFVELRKLYVTLKHTSLRWRIRQYIHLVADAKIAKINPFKQVSNKLLVLLNYPAGWLLYHYLCYKHNHIRK